MNLTGTDLNPYAMRIYDFCTLLALASLLVAGTFQLSGPAHAQAPYMLDPESSISIEGTSTRSDWLVHAEDVSGTFEVSREGSAAVVHGGQITIQSAQIKSGESTIMDRLMHDALMVDEHPEITYELTSAESSEGSSPEESFSLNTTGRLTLTGTTNDVQIEVVGTPLANGKIRFTGSHPMKMTDYGMTPPTAMFGQLRTRDDIVVHLDIVVAPAN